MIDVPSSCQVRNAGGRVDNLVHKNVQFLVCDDSAIKMNTQVRPVEESSRLS